MLQKNTNGLDNASGLQPDACPGEAGTSTVDRFGCVDDDGDGYSNETDAFPSDPTRWIDTDNDGFDDAEDACPTTTGNSSTDRLGCVDSDGDGVSDPAETALINNFTFTVENYDSDARYKVEVKVNGNWTDYTTGANAQLVNGTNVLYNPNTVSGVNGITQLAVINGTDYEAVRISAVTEQTGTSQQYDGGKFKVTVDNVLKSIVLVINQSSFALLPPL